MRIDIFFGVRIDDLFSVNHEDELERVAHILSYERLTEQSYLYAKRTLDASLQDNADDVRTLKSYAHLHLKKTNDDLLEAGRMLEKAMELSPLDEEIYALYRQVRGGGAYKAHSDDDWFIRVCEPYAKRFPQNTKLMVMLVEAMIRMRYFEKAEEHIHLMRLDNSKEYLRQIYLGELEMARGNLDCAKVIWNAFHTAVVPRYLDAVLYTKLGRKAEAIEAWQLIIDTLASDYNDCDSDTVEWAKREIRKLQEL